MLLLVATEFDPHADIVVAALHQKGFEEIFRLDLDTAFDKQGFTLSATERELGWTVEGSVSIPVEK